MKWLLILFLIVELSISSAAQKINGHVIESSVTSVNQEPIQGVSLKIRGNTNYGVTDRNGNFSITLNGQKNGNQYILTNVYKKGYELADPSLIGRPMAYSSSVKLQIAMLSSKILNEKKNEIENRIYCSTQKYYDSKLALLNDSLEKGRMALDEFLKQSKFLQDQFNAYEPLISTLSDHYVRLDYSNMTQKDREVCVMIMDGKIETADSLISILEKELQYKRESFIKEKEDITNDLFNKYAIALAKFEPTKAGEYIYLRAQVDSTNVDCLLEAGAFACDFLSDFEKSERFYESAISESLSQYGQESEKYAICLNHMGGLYLKKSKYKESLDLRMQALEIRVNLYGNMHTSVAACYNNLANIYYSLDKLNEAKECGEKAIYIYQNIEDCIPSDYCAALNTLGGIYLAAGNWDLATTLFENAIKICDEQYGAQNTHSATALNNLAVVKDYQEKYNESIPIYMRTLGIYEKLYGNIHPNVATIYSNLADSYKQTQRYDSAMIYHSKALEIRLDLFGEYHEDIAISLNNIGSLFSAVGQYDTAIDFYGKCLTVWNTILGKDNPRFATTIGNMGVLYYRKKDYNMALACFEESLDIYVKDPKNYSTELKSLGELAAMSYYYLEQENTLTEKEEEDLKNEFEEFKRKYSKYILPE